MAEETVVQRLRTELPSLRGSQQRLARYLLSRYPVAAMAPAAEAARQALVSEATAYRLATRLGYRSYRHLKWAVRLEIEQGRILAFAEREWSQSAGDPPAAAYPRSLAARQIGIEIRLLQALEASGVGERIDRAAEMLRGARRKYVVGGQGSRYLGQHAAYFLSLALDDVHGFGPGDAEVAAHVVATTVADLWLMICMPRYDRRTVRLARHLREQGFPS